MGDRHVDKGESSRSLALEVILLEVERYFAE